MSVLGSARHCRQSGKLARSPVGVPTHRSRVGESLLMKWHDAGHRERTMTGQRNIGCKDLARPNPAASIQTLQPQMFASEQVSMEIWMPRAEVLIFSESQSRLRKRAGSRRRLAVLQARCLEVNTSSGPHQASRKEMIMVQVRKKPAKGACVPGAVLGWELVVDESIIKAWRSTPASSGCSVVRRCESAMLYAARVVEVTDDGAA